MQDLSGVKLTTKFDSYRLQSAGGPSSSSTGKTPEDGTEEAPLWRLHFDIHFAALFLGTPERKLFAEKCISAMDVLGHLFIFLHWACSTLLDIVWYMS